jgi:broad specificity phosphatase PhoE
MVKVTIHWVRHGESCSNVGTWSDKLKHPPLTNKGIEQAKFLGKNYLNHDYDIIFSSPLIRTLMTCFYSISESKKKPVEGMPAKQEITIFLNPNIAEKPDFGAYLGSTQNAIISPSVLKKFMETFTTIYNNLKFDLNYKYLPEANNYKEYNDKANIERNINNFYEQIKRNSKLQGKKEIKILCFAHGGIIKDIYEHRTHSKFTQKIINPNNIVPCKDNELFNTQIIEEVYTIVGSETELNIKFNKDDINLNGKVYKPLEHYEEFTNFIKNNKDISLNCNQELFDKTKDLGRLKYLKYKNKYLRLKKQLNLL